MLGEGSSAVQHNGLGEGESRTPHPTVFVEHSALPSPARGEGTITSAEFSDAVVLVRVTHGAAGICFGAGSPCPRRRSNSGPCRETARTGCPRAEPAPWRGQPSHPCPDEPFPKSLM